VNCGFCAKPFEENQSQPACRSCPVGSGCGLIRCPHCGYENPGTPGWIAYLRKKFGGGSDAEVGAMDRRDLPVLQPYSKEARP
jgi:hypothetical protein